MELLTAWLLLCFQTIVAGFSAEEASISRSSYFDLRENRRLKGYVVKRFDSPSLLTCGHECIRNSWCTSTNFLMSPEKNNRGICELNQHEVPLGEEQTELLVEEDVTFAIPIKGCVTGGCLNGGSCLPDKEKRTFTCSCQQPWAGDKCEIKDTESSTCKGIYMYDRNLSKENKAYLLRVGSVDIPVFCHMTNLGACGGGGWTLVLKINGSQRTFHYDSELWGNNKTFNIEGGKTGFDKQESKLPTYFHTPFTKICLGMKIAGNISYILINKTANSLYTLIADGTYNATSLGRDTWKRLIGSEASLQTNCNREGFNVVVSSNSWWPRARIGIVSNNQHDCGSCDSRIGFGTGGYPDDNNACGNEAFGIYESDNGEKHITAMGYILVQ